MTLATKPAPPVERKPPRRAQQPRRTYRVELVGPETPEEWANVLPTLKRICDVFNPPPPPQPVATKLRLYKSAHRACEGCAYRPTRALRSSALHIHHVTPRSKSGTHEPDNLVVVCARCHALAHAVTRKKPMTKRVLLRKLAALETKRRRKAP